MTEWHLLILGFFVFTMEIISLSNHIVRKALCLSLNEMAVLCDIKHMSQNPQFGYQCVKTKEKIASWLDLSRATVFNAISALVSKGYIERTSIGVRPSQFIYDLDSCQEEIGLMIKKGDTEMITQKVAQLLDAPSKNYTKTVQNLDGDSLKFRPGPSKIYTQDNNIDIQEKERKNNTPQPAVAEPKPETKIHPLQQYIKENCPRVSRLQKQLTYEEAESITKEFDRQLIKDKLLAMENKKKLDYISVNLTLRNWLKKEDRDTPGTPAKGVIKSGGITMNLTS